jgi:Lecithin retinol acyltransferase
MLSLTSADSNEALASLLATANVALDTDLRAAKSCYSSAAMNPAARSRECSEVLPSEYGGRNIAQVVDVTHVAHAESALLIGAYIVTRRHRYTHHGIYAGVGQVVHYAGLSRGLRGGPVEETSPSRFAAGHPVSVVSGIPPRFEGWMLSRSRRAVLPPVRSAAGRSPSQSST